MPRVAKKPEVKINPFAQVVRDLKVSSQLEPKTEIVQSAEIVDIITFCDDPRFLNLPNNGLNLWLPQRIMLKCFYIGSIGNEKLELTQEDWDWLYANEKDEELDGEVYQKNISDVIIVFGYSVFFLYN